MKNETSEIRSLQDYREFRQAQLGLTADCQDVTLVSQHFGELLGRGLMKDAYNYYQQAYNVVGTEAGENAVLFWQN